MVTAWGVAQVSLALSGPVLLAIHFFLELPWVCRMEGRQCPRSALGVEPEPPAGVGGPQSGLASPAGQVGVPALASRGLRAGIWFEVCRSGLG